MSTSIPINHYRAAAADKELKRLLRAKDAASGRVERAQKEEQEAEAAITAYIAATYPATESVAEVAE